MSRATTCPSGCAAQCRFRPDRAAVQPDLPPDVPVGVQDCGFGDFEMLSIFRRLAKNEKGATAIEYTLIASLIAVAAIASMRTVGGKVTNVLTNVSNSMT